MASWAGSLVRHVFHVRDATNAPWWKNEVVSRKKVMRCHRLYLVVEFSSGWQEW